MKTKQPRNDKIKTKIGYRHTVQSVMMWIKRAVLSVTLKWFGRERRKKQERTKEGETVRKSKVSVKEARKEREIDNNNTTSRPKRINYFYDSHSLSYSTRFTCAPFDMRFLLFLYTLSLLFIYDNAMEMANNEAHLNSLFSSFLANKFIHFINHFSPNQWV